MIDFKSKYEYHSGHKKAEWYKARGWQIISVGIDTILFQKERIK